VNFGSADNFEKKLAAAMRARPEPLVALNLAELAMFRARQFALAEERLARLARIRRWSRLVTIAAVVLIGALVAIGYRMLPASTTVDATSDTATTTTTIDFTTMGLAAFLVVLIAVVLGALLSPERPEVRITSV
jgi:hypothetical protein